MSIFFARQGVLLAAIGDIHGRHDSLLSLLEALGKKYSLVRGNTVKYGSIVFLGDYINRGNASRKVIETVKSLKENNPGAVTTLIGNHELMALYHHSAAVELQKKYRRPRNDVLGEAKPDFDGELLPIRQYESNYHGANGGINFIKEFAEDPTQAFSLYVSRMSETGDIGAWMRSLEPFHLSEFAGKKILFSQGDLPPGVLNISDAAEFYKSGQKIDYAAKAGKYFDNCNLRKISGEDMRKFLDNVGVDYAVTAHTKADSITTLEGRIFRMDAGMGVSSEPRALVFKKNGVYSFGTVSGEKKIIGF